jgi:transposase
MRVTVLCGILDCMARPTLLILTDSDRERLTREMTTTAVADTRDACRAVLSIGDGLTRAAVGEQFGVHPSTIGRWLAQFRKRGVAGLRGPETDGRGRPRRLTAEHLKLLRKTALTSPKELGYAFTTWTLPRLAAYLLEKEGVTAQPEYLGRLLHRSGLTRQRPKHVLEGKRDESEHDKAKVELQAIKDDIPNSKRVVISQDETEFHLYPYLVMVWCVIGSPQPYVRTPGKNQKRVLYGGLDLGTGKLTSYWAATKSGTHFIEFLMVLLAAYPDRKILLIMDNGSFHHTKAVASFIETNSARLEVKWLPPYCPDLNDIERTWRRLKASHASNFLFNSLDELADNVQKGINELNLQGVTSTN